MRIIKEGKLPKEEEIEGTCHYCKTVFSFTKREGEIMKHILHGSSIIQPHFHSNRILLVCPFCYIPTSVRL